EPHNNLGSLLQLQGRFGEAMACFDAALRALPQAAEAHRNRALLRLLLGDFEQGWPEDEWRFRLNGAARPHLSQLPGQADAKQAGGTVLVWAEQGLGDVIQFVRYAPLVRQSAARVLLQCTPAMHPLLGTAPGIDRLVTGGNLDEPVDSYVPLLSLPAE